MDDADRMNGIGNHEVYDVDSAMRSIQRARRDNRDDFPIARNNDVLPMDDGALDDQWAVEPVRPDLQTTPEQDEDYELRRWAAWTRSLDEVSDDMMESDDWGLKAPEDFRLSDETFQQRFGWSHDADSESIDGYVNRMSFDDMDVTHMRLLRREYWRRKDRGWCFLCWYHITVDQARQVPAYAKLKQMTERNFHEQSLSALCTQIQDLFMREVRHLLPGRGNDPLTSEPIPQRYWHIAQIRKHIVEHVPSVNYDVEAQFKTYVVLCDKLMESVLERDRRTGRLRANASMLKLYNDTVARKQALWKFVLTLRSHQASRR